MNHSSMYVLEDSSEWDPKVIRNHLYISEEQLNILSHIPGWSKVAEEANTLRLGKDITETSQSSQFSFSATSQDCQRKKQGIDLFDKYLQLQGSVLKTYEVYRKKFKRSISLFDIDKISNTVSDIKAIERTLSLSALNLSYNSETASTEKSLSCISKVLPAVEYSVISDQKDTSVPKPASPSKANLEAMEVISQIPVNISRQIEKVASHETAVNVEKNDMVSTIHVTTNSCNLNDQQTIVANVVVSANNSTTVIYDKENKGKPNVNSSENELDSETVPKDVDFSTNAEKDSSSLNSEKFSEGNKKLAENLTEPAESTKPISNEQSLPAENLISNNQKNSDFQNITPKVLHAQKLCQETGDEAIKPVTRVKATPEKRKLSIKMKSSKKRRQTRERPEHNAIRSIKRAGEIHYSDEDIKTMINIIKCFL